jgi:hypothetical protein
MSDCVRVYQAEDAEAEDDQVLLSSLPLSHETDTPPAFGAAGLFTLSVARILQCYVPAERPDADPFEKERMRRSMLIRRFLVFMRDIKQNQYLSANFKWPPVVGSETPATDVEDWNKWKSKVPVPARVMCTVEMHALVREGLSRARLSLLHLRVVRRVCVPYSTCG